MYRMIILYFDGTLREMEISQSTSVKLEVGKIYTASISGSRYKVLSIRKEG